MQNLSCALKDEQVLIRPRGGNGDSQGKKKPLGKALNLEKAWQLSGNEDGHCAGVQGT